MNKEATLTITGALAILLMDTVGALLSAQLHFRYTLLFPVSLIVYTWVTYQAAKQLTLPGALGFGAFLGLVDATIGWKISELLGADPERHLEKINRSAWIGTVLSVVIMGAAIALVTFLIATRGRQRDDRG